MSNQVRIIFIINLIPSLPLFGLLAFEFFLHLFLESFFLKLKLNLLLFGAVTIGVAVIVWSGLIV